jgi:hypothetical protein
VIAPDAPARLAAWAGSLVRTRSRGEARVGEAAYPRLTAIRIGILAAIALELLHPPIWSPSDDRHILEDAGAFGLSSLWIDYAGYLIVVQRALAFVVAPDPFLLGALATYLAAGAVAAFLAWRVHPLAPLALFVPLDAVYGTLSNIQWILAVYMLGMLVASPPRSAGSRLADYFGVFLCGLTGPFAIVLLPLYGIRAIGPAWRWHLLAIAAAAGFQILVMLNTPRINGPGDNDILAVMAARVAIPLAMIVVTAIWLPKRWVAGALFVGGLIPVLGIVTTLHTTPELVAWAGSRYFYLTWVMAIGLGVLAAVRARARYAVTEAFRYR